MERKQREEDGRRGWLQMTLFSVLPLCVSLLCTVWLLCLPACRSVCLGPLSALLSFSAVFQARASLDSLLHKHKQANKRQHYTNNRAAAMQMNM